MHEPSRSPGAAKGAPARAQVVPQRLSFWTVRDLEDAAAQIEKHPELFLFSSHDPIKYVPYAQDFGPVDLSVVHEFCRWFKGFYLHPLLLENGKELVFYTLNTMEATTNAAFLIGSFLMIELQWTPEDAWRPFASGLPSAPVLGTFRDATETRKDYGLSVLSCLKGLHKAMQCGWYSPSTFDASSYHELAAPHATNLHFITPKLAAFAGPIQDRPMNEPGPGEPEVFVEAFKKHNVSAVVRLNKPHYDPTVFTQEGLEHFDLYFQDCTTPSNQIMQEFIDIVERAPGAVAVHCRAGLGRTGTLIAVHMMKYHSFGAAEAIAWLRIVRPGSVLGPQQRFLHQVERVLSVHIRTRLRASGESLISSRSSMSMSSDQSPGYDSDASEIMGEKIATAQHNRAKRMLQKGTATPPLNRDQLMPARPTEPSGQSRHSAFKLPEVSSQRGAYVNVASTLLSQSTRITQGRNAPGALLPSAASMIRRATTTARPARVRERRF